MRRKRWTVDQLRAAANESLSMRELLGQLGLKQAGGNYEGIRGFLTRYSISTTHFLGQRRSKGVPSELHRGKPMRAKPLEEILTAPSSYSSHKLKRRLFQAGAKAPACELCGWSTMSPDGRIPVELDHINGDPHDNRLSNLRILCPNCHSLQPTHRSLNQKPYRASGETGDTRDT